MKWANEIVEWPSSPETLKSVECEFWIFSKNRSPSSPAAFILRPWSAPEGKDLLLFNSRLRAVSYFSLQSYCTRNLSTRAAKARAARNEGVTPRRKKMCVNPLLRSRYENATPNLCWVFCTLLDVLCNYLRLHFRRRHTFASLWGPCLRFASLWSANSTCGDSCVLGVHLWKVCWGLLFCLRKAFIF